MYSEWVSLQTSIQSDNSHASVLKRFPAAVGKDIVVPVVKTIAQGLSLNSSDQPSKLGTAEEVNWTMEVRGFLCKPSIDFHIHVSPQVSIYQTKGSANELSMHRSII